MKKRFKETRFGKVLLNPTVKVLLKSVPFVGGLAGNILDEVNGHGEGELISDAGTINRSDLIPQLVQIGWAVLLAGLALAGVISWEDAETAKSFTP